MSAQPISPAPLTVSPDSFRHAMGEVATPVTVVTTRHLGQDRGTTVSAFASLSLQPPMVLVCLDRGSTLMADLEPGAKVGVNILSEGQHEDAVRFARKGTDKFAGAAYHYDQGLPRLDATAGWLACAVEEVLDGGDHFIVTARVEHADHTGRAPMVYRNRTFGGFASAA